MYKLNLSDQSPMESGVVRSGWHEKVTSSIVNRLEFSKGQCQEEWFFFPSSHAQYTRCCSLKSQLDAETEYCGAPQINFVQVDHWATVNKVIKAEIYSTYSFLFPTLWEVSNHYSPQLCHLEDWHRNRVSGGNVPLIGWIGSWVL